jgi:hypothetical protein
MKINAENYLEKNNAQSVIVYYRLERFKLGKEHKL